MCMNSQNLCLPQKKKGWLEKLQALSVLSGKFYHHPWPDQQHFKVTGKMSLSKSQVP